jgi:hypothetical protein
LVGSRVTKDGFVPQRAKACPKMLRALSYPF